jgi:hypothetical protein
MLPNYGTVTVPSKQQKKALKKTPKNRKKNPKKSRTFFNPEPGPDRKPTFEQKTDPDPDRLPKVNTAGLYSKP